ncbi:MAG: DNA repair protein RecO [Gemmobacter sp.]
MEWQGEGILLAVRPHGESAAIIEVMTLAQGRHSGVVRGGSGRRLAPVLQPGAQLALTWRARLSEHIGVFTVEPLRQRAPALLGDARALAGLSSVCALLVRVLPERDPHPGLYHSTIGLLDRIGVSQGWMADYLRWELALLADLGFGLDLETCAVTGSASDLAYVSPRTGRAVARTAAGDWAPRLLPLPGFLTAEGGPEEPAAVAEGLRLTTHFLNLALAAGGDGRSLPEPRLRLAALTARG